MSDSYVRLQPSALRPAWVSVKNDLFANVRRDFGTGVLKWEQASGFLARLFNTSWEPNFVSPTAVGSVPDTAWASNPVALQSVVIDSDGYCRAHGLRFGPLLNLTSYLIHGCCIYQPSGRLVWAATDYLGSFPTLNQDCYVVWDGNYGPFRL